jgi:hypothetical protein
MKLEEIDIGKTDEERRKVILDNLGKQVILRDVHLGLCHAKLIKENDIETYFAQLGDRRGFQRLTYNDLETLIVLYPVESYPLPEMFTQP